MKNNTITIDIYWDMSNDEIWNQCYIPMKLVYQETMKNTILTFLHVEMKGGLPDIISETLV